MGLTFRLYHHFIRPDMEDDVVVQRPSLERGFYRMEPDFQRKSVKICFYQRQSAFQRSLADRATK
jgi:hypothetical protein